MVSLWCGFDLGFWLCCLTWLGRLYHVVRTCHRRNECMQGGISDSCIDDFMLFAEFRAFEMYELWEVAHH